MREWVVNIIGILCGLSFIYTAIYQDKIIDKHKELLDKLFGVDKKTFWKYSGSRISDH